MSSSTYSLSGSIFPLLGGKKEGGLSPIHLFHCDGYSTLSNMPSICAALICLLLLPLPIGSMLFWRKDRHLILTTSHCNRIFFILITLAFCLLQILFMLFLLFWTHFPSLITSHIWVKLFLSVSLRQTIIL